MALLLFYTIKMIFLYSRAFSKTMQLKFCFDNIQYYRLKN